VKQHQKRIFGKLGVHSRTELVAVANAAGRDPDAP
jgi:DNA-binding CsgD family transcriptional regulator